MGWNGALDHGGSATRPWGGNRDSRHVALRALCDRPEMSSPHGSGVSTNASVRLEIVAFPQIKPQPLPETVTVRSAISATTE